MAIGSTDIYKAFDQVQRPLLLTLLMYAGVPTNIIGPYWRCIGALKYRNMVAGGLGEPYTGECSIPQGDAFNMAFISLMLTPWARRMRVMGAIPRLMADDMQIITHGENVLARHVDATDLTHNYLHMMGARVSGPKSVNHATNRSHRIALARKIWRNVKSRIPVKGSARDLGAHLCVSGCIHGATLTVRVRRAIPMVRRIAKMPMHIVRKCRTIKGKIYSSSPYACAATRVSRKAAQALESAVADVMAGATNVLRSPELACMLAPVRGMHPFEHILITRIKALRREYYRHIDTQSMITEIMHLYADAGHACIRPADSGSEEDNTGEDEAESQAKPHGPVLMLLDMLCAMGVSIDVQCNASHTMQGIISLLHAPIQEVTTYCSDVGGRYLTKLVRNRRHFEDCLSVDRDVAVHAACGLDAPMAKMVRIVQCGAVWVATTLHAIGHADAPRCPRCNA